MAPSGQRVGPVPVAAVPRSTVTLVPRRVAAERTGGRVTGDRNRFSRWAAPVEGVAFLPPPVVRRRVPPEYRRSNRSVTLRAPVRIERR
jgi:hypothetical protein